MEISQKITSEEAQSNVWLSAFGREDLRGTHTADRYGIYKNGEKVWGHDGSFVNKLTQAQIRASTLETIKEATSGTSS
jgi:hypothetical protein